jgi:hypothetical protein
MLQSKIFETMPFFSPIKLAKYLARSENYHPNGENARYDLVIATSGLFQKLRRIAGSNTLTSGARLAILLLGRACYNEKEKKC